MIYQDDTAIYLSSTNKSSFIVEKINSQITLDALNKSEVGNKSTITGILRDANLKAIPNANITIKLNNNQTKTITTNNEGKFNATFDLIKSGTNNYTVTYDGMIHITQQKLT